MYLNPETKSNQSTYAPGLIEMTDDEWQIYLSHNGFVTVTENAEAASGYTITADIEGWEAWKATQPDPAIEAKATKIAKSKADLETYLAEHPLQWTDGEYYSITAEKQRQLTSKLMAATMAQASSTGYTLTWNSTGEVCKEWTLEELSALAFAIDARVTALVTYQQTQEVAINAATTVDEVNAIVIDYDSVQ